MGDEATLTPRHDSVALLSILGASDAEIAEVLGLAPSTVRGIVGSPLFQTLANKARQSILARAGATDAVAFINSETMKSLEKIVTLRDSAYDERVQLRASQDIADRNPATARVTKGRSERGQQVPENVMRYIEALVASRTIDAVATPIAEPRVIKLETLDEALASVSVD